MKGRMLKFLDRTSRKYRVYMTFKLKSAQLITLLFLELKNQLDRKTTSILAADNNGENSIKIEHRVRKLCRKSFFFLSETPDIKYLLSIVNSTQNKSCHMTFHSKIQNHKAFDELSISSSWM